MIQRGPTWGQLEANMVLQILEKPLFFPFLVFQYLKEILESFWERLGKPSGMPWGAVGDLLGTPGEALGTPWEALGTPWPVALSFLA